VTFVQCGFPQLDSNSIEHFPYTARRRWHIDVAQPNTTVESIDDSVDDRRRRADGAGLTRALDAQWVSRRGARCGLRKRRAEHRQRAAWRSP
jgi:hypothetical protein